MSESQLMDPRDVQQLERLETVSKRLETLPEFSQASRPAVCSPN